MNDFLVNKVLLTGKTDGKLTKNEEICPPRFERLGTKFYTAEG
jgi:hypothetical protein